ncbi:conserved protein [Tepidicaulis marinus]|uniref:Conserved protein n=1 Tax=Tepidicaulis marinus TaxID=1333998 RepID=A0A081B7R3_9HYPH|nr:conserved protein [Tepidicaulis marinus]
MNCSSDCAPEGGKYFNSPRKDEPVSEELQALITRAGQLNPPILLDPTLSFEYRIPAAGLGYWNAKRPADGRLPPRSAVNPAELAKYLPALALIDVSENENGGIELFSRLAGAEVERVFGMMSRQDLRKRLPPEIFARWQIIFRALWVAEAPLRITSRIAYEDKTYLYIECLFAPLANSDPNSITSLIFAEFRMDS